MKMDVTKEWCMTMAQREAGAEVGAGLLAADPVFDGKAVIDDLVRDESRLAFGRFVNLMRRGRGLSIEQLAESADIEVGEIMSIEEGVRRITSEQADLYGLSDRGRLEPGKSADVVVLDYDRLELEESEEAHDLPGGSMRLKQVAKGIPYTIVNGSVLIENGVHTGALPGQVLRGQSNGKG